jgi:cold shock CspA family protein
MVTRLASALAGALVGAAAGVLFCWFGVAVPTATNLRALEAALAEARRLDQAERREAAALRQLSTDGVAKWAAAVDAQAARFAELERLAHEQELRLAAAPQAALVAAAVAALGVVALVVHWLRDANASAAATLDALASLAPEAAPRAAVRARHDRHRVLTGSSAAPAPPPPPSGRPPPLAVEGPRFDGTVQRFRPEHGNGWIAVPGGPELFFDLGDVDAADRGRIGAGVRVTFCRRNDARSRPRARGVRVDARR